MPAGDQLLSSFYGFSRTVDWHTTVDAIFVVRYVDISARHVPLQVTHSTTFHSVLFPCFGNVRQIRKMPKSTVG